MTAPWWTHYGWFWFPLIFILVVIFGWRSALEGLAIMLTWVDETDERIYPPLPFTIKGFGMVKQWFVAAFVVLGNLMLAVFATTIVCVLISAMLRHYHWGGM